MTQEIRPDAPEAYHRWYYDNEIWEKVTWRGVNCLKSVTDLWNYQEIISELKPGLIIEFGTRIGGSALFLIDAARLVNPACRILTVDQDRTDLDPMLKEHPAIELHTASSTDPSTLECVQRLRRECTGPVFAILDSDHRKAHVLNEMLLLRQVLHPGDYLVVEDGNINGHPVLPGWGEGPWEALEEYMSLYPDDYRRDRTREEKFGFTFAPRGYLIRRAAGT